MTEFAVTMPNYAVEQSTLTDTVNSANVISLQIKLLDRQLHIHNIYNPVHGEELSTSIPI